MADLLRCVCGSTEWGGESARRGVVVDAHGKSHDTEIRVARCGGCGLARQVGLPFSTEAEYAEYYRNYPPVTAEYEAKNYQHDREVARARCDDYKFARGARLEVLDVGSGSGAFVEECLSRGLRAVGCDIALYESRAASCRDSIYQSRFEDVHFPTDKFDVVTLHDVLEHVLDPAKFLAEAFRVTKQNGTCVVEVPDFYAEGGEHHWKRAEHIWFFGARDLELLAGRVGFSLARVERPVKSKLRAVLVKPERKRARILLPPGIGDSYWSLVKMRAFIEKYKTGLPEVLVACNRVRELGGSVRAFPFIEMFPFVHASGEAIANEDYPDLRSTWTEAYSTQGRTVFTDVCGCDYFLSYNGHLRYGEQLEQVDPDLRCEWFPPMFVSLEQERFRRECVAKYGRYVALYFMFKGTYKHWSNEFPMKSVAAFINTLTRATGVTPVLVGAVWDKTDQYLNLLARNVEGCVDLRGKTSVEQAFGLLRGAAATVGYPSGLTIMSAVLRVKTLIVWNRYYNRDFFWYCAPPETRGTNYQIEVTRGLSPDKLASVVSGMVGDPHTPAEVHKVTRRKRGAEVPRLKAERPLVIATTLGGANGYNERSVYLLKDALRANVMVDHKFFCFTDCETMPRDITVVPLSGKTPGAWSTLEIFRKDVYDELLKGCNVMYFDLDLLVLDKLDQLVTHEHDFTMMANFSTAQHFGLWSPAFMAFSGDHSYLYTSYLEDESLAPRPELLSRHIAALLRATPNSLQMVQPGVYSYKRHCHGGLPPDATIVWFHGRPKYYEVGDPWVLEATAEINGTNLTEMGNE